MEIGPSILENEGVTAVRRIPEKKLFVGTFPRLPPYCRRQDTFTGRLWNSGSENVRQLIIMTLKNPWEDKGFLLLTGAGSHCEEVKLKKA